MHHGACGLLGLATLHAAIPSSRSRCCMDYVLPASQLSSPSPPFPFSSALRSPISFNVVFWSWRCRCSWTGLADLALPFWAGPVTGPPPFCLLLAGREVAVAGRRPLPSSCVLRLWCAFGRTGPMPCHAMQLWLAGLAGWLFPPHHPYHPHSSRVVRCFHGDTLQDRRRKGLTGSPLGEVSSSRTRFGGGVIGGFQDEWGTERRLDYTLMCSSGAMPAAVFSHVPLFGGAIVIHHCDVWTDIARLVG
ncbi:hypothetical protein B0I37DRAFT_10677 [Chaetomium sp. MPI-CAGE-AT-0009]|nr:hypothetical protein B0I37DRAFT_10677 [Chaetomium sp. MPI-CAGE-AT-0009]